MKIAIASDHGGYSMKKFLAGYLLGRGYEILDLGTDSTDSVDYPAFGKACGEAVSSGQAQKGIVVCGTGIGISIAANKVKGIRCALCTSVEMAKLLLLGHAEKPACSGKKPLCRRIRRGLAQPCGRNRSLRPPARRELPSTPPHSGGRKKGLCGQAVPFPAHRPPRKQ